MIDDDTHSNNSLRHLLGISADEFNTHEVDLLKMMGLINFGS